MAPWDEVVKVLQEEGPVRVAVPGV
jgi:hypothetical protein